tara:strand:+ start:79 stop:222 length:144 start_codon:yes stop_codon:yes gene_type:complete
MSLSSQTRSLTEKRNEAFGVLLDSRFTLRMSDIFFMDLAFFKEEVIE